QGEMYPPAENFYGYSTPFPIVLNDTLHLFFDVAQEDPEWLQVAIHHAYSADGINDFIQDEAAIFHKDDFDWTQREIRAPAVLADEGQLKMWFCGDDIFATAKWGIGYAWSNDFSVNNIEFITEPITIFPNPANDYLTIKSNEQWDNFTLTDLTGKIILSILSGTENSINVSFVPPGIYFAQLKSKEMILETRKIIISH
ncbi:MAG TPA: T9SS type A sorting domain-containing protein, partial [Chitinophagales bacterium]|nr:T9SS type A sorting domain-containing protein [Chitinophagales bacterium]